MHANFAPAVYLLASHRNGTTYVGVTSDLVQRLHQHRESLIDGFSKDYGAHRLVWCDYGARDHAGEADQEVESGLEDQADRGKQSGLA